MMKESTRLPYDSNPSKIEIHRSR